MEGGCAHSQVARRWAAAVVLAAAAMLLPATASAQTPAPVATVPFVDLDRYAGDWFEIARFPNRFQRQCIGDVRASYARRPDGRLDVVNRCRTADGQTEARGIGRIVDDQTFARLKVRFAPAWLSFLPVVWGDYWIIGLAPDYSWAVVGDPGRDYLWILARTPRLDEESVSAARAAARASGYDVARLVQTSHAGGGGTKLADVVGETTGGGANPGGTVRLAAGLTMFIPGGRARNPITGTNWEGVGVNPDIAVPSESALKAALDQLSVSSVGGEIDTLSRSRVFEPGGPRQ